MNNKLGNRLRFIRDEFNLSAEKLAEIIKEKPHRIRDIERGKQKCPPEILQKYLEYFHVNLNWLISGEGSMWKDGDEQGRQGQGSGDERQGVDPRTEKILKLIEKLDDEAKDDVFKYIQKIEQIKKMEKKIRELEERIKVAGE